nr:hypothetical protein [Tanacetum cinerariifolium]
MDGFCFRKGIKREFSNARTPQQNGVAERRNRTFIKAARTMLADAKFPATFWAEAVNIACYVQNMVLVTRLHNKTPYELFNERSHVIGFLRPFGCHVMILITLDHLGKFDAKGDEGTSSTNISGIKEDIHQTVKGKESPIRFIDLPNWFHEAQMATSNEAAKKDDAIPDNNSPQKEQQKVNGDKEVPESNHKSHCYSHVPPDSLSVPPVTSSVPRIISKGGSSFPEPLSLGNAMPFKNRLEDLFGDTSNAVSLNEVEADLGNMETAIQLSPTPTLRIHKDHLTSQIIGPIDTPIQTRQKNKDVDEQSFIDTIHQKTNPDLLQYCQFSCFLSQEEPKKIVDALKNLRWVKAMQQELLQFKIQNVWEEGINYKEVFAPVARIKAIRLFLAYASYMGYIVYQMDAKSAFLYGTIDEEVYVMQPPGFQDPEFPHRVYKVEKAMYGLHQASKAWYGTFSKSMIGSLMYLTTSRPDIMFDVYAYARHQVAPKECHLHAVKRIFRYLKGNPKLGLWYPKESPFDLVAYSDSDYSGANQDRKSTTGGCQFLGRSYKWLWTSALDKKPVAGLWFRSTARVETTNGETKILAQVNGRQRTVSESLIRRHLKLNDEEDETAFPSGDVRYGEAFPTDTSLDARQDRENIAKTFAMPHEALPRVTSLGGGKGNLEITQLKTRIKTLKDNERRREGFAQEDAPNTGGMDQGEDLLVGDTVKDSDKSANKGSDCIDEMSHVLGSLRASNILASGGLRSFFTTASLSVATASIDISPVVAIVSGSFPTAVIFTTASVATPTTRVTRSSRGVVIRSSSLISVNIPSISKKDKGKEKMIEPKQPSKEEVLEQMSIQLARDLEAKFAQEDLIIREQAKRYAEIARIHAEKELEIMNAELDRSNEMISKYLSEYEQAAVGLSHDEKIEEKFIPVWEKMQDFVPMNSKLESERLKRPGIQLDKERIKKLKTTEASGTKPTQEQQSKDPKELSKEELKRMMKLVHAEELYIKALQQTIQDNKMFGSILSRLSVPTADVYIAKKLSTVEDFALLHEDKIYSESKTRTAVQNSNFHAQQDALILSVIEQLKTQVVNCTKINLDNKSVDDTLTAELERYKEQVRILKEGQNVDLKNKDNVSDSCAQSVEIDHLKQTLSEYLKEKESLMQTVTLLKNDFKKEKSRNIDREISLEQRIKHLDNIVFKGEPTPSSRPTKVKVPKVRMVNTSLKKLKQHLASFDMVIKERTTATSMTEDTWGFKHTKAYFRDEIIPFVKALKDLFNSFDQFLVDELSEVQHVYHQMEQAMEQHHEKVLVITALKDNLRKLKGKAIVNDDVTSHPIDPEMLTVDVAPLAPKLQNNKTAHSNYIRHTQEQTAILSEIVEQETSLNFLNNSLDYVYIASVLHSKLNVNSNLKCVTCNGCLFYDNHDSYVLEFINNVNARVKSKSVKKTLKRKVWKPTGKVFTNIRYIWRPTCRTFIIVGNVCPLTRITTTAEVLLRKPIPLESDIPKPVVMVIIRLGMLRSRGFNSWKDLARQGLVWGLPKLKFEKDHLCSACAVGKSKKKSHKPKSENTNQEELYLLHMDLCGPMRVESVNGKKYILVIVDDYSRFTWVKCLSSGPALHEMTPATINSGLVPNPTSLTPFVPPSRTDWGMLFQLMFDELLTPPPIVDHPAPEVIAPIAEVIAPEPAASTGLPSSITVDQDTPSPNVAHMNNNPFFGISILEVPSDQSSSTNVNYTIVHHDHQISEHNSKWTKDHLLENIIGKLARPVSTRLKLHEQALFDYYDVFLTSVEPKTYKDTLTQSCWINAMQKELNEFERLGVWELIPQPNKVMVIILKWIYKVKLDELGGILKNKAWDSKELLLLQIYVNDIIFTAFTPELCDSNYALKSLKKYDFKSCDPLDTPMVEKSKLDEAKEGKVVDPSHYRGMIGTLLYLIASRPDLQFAICMCARSKHIDIRYHFIREHVKNGVIKLYFVNTEYQLADIFTKALGRERIELLINKLGMRSFTPETLKQLTDKVDE